MDARGWRAKRGRRRPGGVLALEANGGRCCGAAGALGGVRVAGQLPPVRAVGAERLAPLGRRVLPPLSMQYQQVQGNPYRRCMPRRWCGLSVPHTAITTAPPCCAAVCPVPLARGTAPKRQGDLPATGSMQVPTAELGWSATASVILPSCHQ